MNKKDGLVFVWPVSTRIIHWLIVASFTGAFITSYYEYMLHDHVAFGFIFGVMLIYRIIWGFIGPRYATFNTFKLKPSQLKDYFVEKVKNRWRKIPPGHNPASSWYTILVLTLGFIIVVSGLLLYGVQEAKGIFKDLNDQYYQYMDILFYIHKYTAYFLAGWALIHITGVLIEQFYHKTNMVFAMINGYKKSEGEDTEVSKSLTFFAYLMIVLAVGIYFFIISSDYNFLTTYKYSKVNYQEKNRVYYDKCGHCHKIYPPFLLPKESWKRVMDDLSNHFGEEITDENITKHEQLAIRKFLYENSAEHSTRESAVKILKSLNGRAPKAITKTPYWRETHKNIPRSVFKSKKIKDKSNCVACHRDIDEGILDDMDIIFR